VAVVHVEGEFRPKGGADKKARNIISAVVQERENGWEIVAFHNAPVQRREEEVAGFVIRVEGVDAREGGEEMIKEVPLIGVFVNDQEAAIDFYTEKLGLTKVQDDAYGPEARWITVSPAKSKIRIVLKKAQKDNEKAMVGNSDGAPVLTLGTDDVRGAHERLRERGVRFLGEPYRYPWGIGALLLDQDGSPILLQQETDQR
jgi:predicted enzyme related to lactoylglutathione lyase